MSRPIQIERVKTIVLVVLFSMTILLLYFSWKDSFFGNIKIPIDFLYQEEAIALPEVIDLIEPNEIIVNFGSDTHTIVSPKDYDYWHSFTLQLGGFLNAEDLNVVEITKAQFDEAMGFRSIRLKFNYSLPFTDTLGHLGIELNTNSIPVETFTGLAYSSAIQDSIIIFDINKQKYYRAISSYDLSAVNLMIDSIEKNAYDAYFPMSVFLGIDSLTLMPISISTAMKEVAFGKEINYYENEKIVKFAQTFFGEGFDFVRKITESNGTTIYMYGYGQKILILNKDGAIEYKEELGDAAYSPLDYYNSLEAAIAYVGAHGSWESLNGTKLTPYLKKAIPITVNNKNGYRFIFSMLINNYSLNLEGSKEVLSVDILGKTVVNYKRQMLDISQSTLDSLIDATEEQTVDPINILSNSHMEIKNILNAAGIIIPGTAETELFENTSLLVDEIKMGYVKIDEADGTQTGKIYPAWIFKVGDINIYFDIFSGKLLGNPDQIAGEI